MNLLEMVAGNQIDKTGEVKKLSVPGSANSKYDVIAIPLEYLYYNDQNGRINTAYKKYKSEKGELTPEVGDSIYNEIFEDFIYDSNKAKMEDTIASIKEKNQQEPGVVLSDGRVIDGNRRLTALRRLQKERGIPQTFNAVILHLDAHSKVDEKKIKEIELDLQLGREERVDYNPIDRIFDVYNTIEVEGLMTKEEYRKASGAGNTKGINRDIRLAKLILKFIDIVSPGDDAINRFYLARDLNLDGPIEEIDSTIDKLKMKDKEAITDAVLVYLAATKADKNPNDNQKDPTRVMRELKTNVLKNPEVLQYYLDAVDDKVDTFIDFFESNPIQSASDLKKFMVQDDTLQETVRKLKESTGHLIHKGQNDSKRRRSLVELEDLRDKLENLSADDFFELTTDENIEAKEILREITDILYKLKKDLKI